MDKRPWRGADDRSRAAGRKCYYKNREKRQAYGKSPERIAKRREKYLRESAALGRVPKLPIPDHERGTRWRPLLASAKYRATSRGLDFNLTSEWALLNYTGFCAVTGIPFVAPIEGINGEWGGPGPFSPSIDRIDPAKGYVTGNCRFILYAVNAMKGRMSDREMFDVAQRIVAVLGPAMNDVLDHNETIVAGIPIASVADDLRLLQRARTL